MEESLAAAANSMELENEFHLLQDNDPKHNAKVVQNYLADNKIEKINDYPPNSPDLNPIENL